MKQVVYKYHVQANGMIDLPGRYEILCCSVQKDEPFIWCLVNPDDIPYSQQFLLVATGSLQNFVGWTYVGTFHNVSGWLVLHLFQWESKV